MYSEWVSILQKSQLFSNCDEDTILKMMRCFSPYHLKYTKNENITVAGDNSKGIGILLKGEAVITKEASDGSRIIITTLMPGDIFGEMVAFSKDRRWPATVVAQDNCEVIFIAPRNIIKSCGEMCVCKENLAENFIRIISDKALILNKKLEYLTIKSVRSRICKFILENYKINNSLTFHLSLNRNELADFLNITRPSLSREMCRLRDEGLIDFHLSSIKILNLESVKSFI